MFIPHSEKRIFNFQISLFTLAFVAIIFTIVSVGGAYYFTKQSTMEKKIVDIREKQIINMERTHHFALYKEVFKKISGKLLGESDFLVIESGLGAFKDNKGTGKGGVEVEGTVINANAKANKNKKNDPKAEEIKELEEIKGNLLMVQKEIKDVRKQLGGQKKIFKYIPSIFPVLGGGYVISGFGFRRDPFNHKISEHGGLDIVNIPGTPIKAAGDGIVKFAQEGGGRGLFVEIQHKFGFSSQYLHLSAIHVDAGDVVHKGQIIGRLGTTGRSTGPHLHYEVRVNNVPIDPAPFITLDRVTKLSGEDKTNPK
jgi:murein DD-endopeptidase MepM/ murein hydrolase activator NlpD